MSRRKERFTARPDTPNNVQMYVCGVTVYDYSHIGHARVYVAFDVLYRLLSRALQYDVQYVRNFTDVDDKIIARANERGEDPLALAGRFIDEFHQDMAALNCLPPSSEPRATDYIVQMCDTIGAIMANGHAYATDDGDVWFEVATLPEYGALSGRSQEDNRAGERVAVDRRKRGPADFALWKHAKPGEVSWDSPWGRGRPGWHIECSAMIHTLMGSTIDIHGGGQDLVFPHHENELAQSQAAAGPCGCGRDHSQRQHGSSSSDAGTGSNSSSSGDGVSSSSSGADGGASTSAQETGAAPFVRYWVHNGFINVDSEKMSKSLGNFFTIRDVLQRYHPLALRWFLVSTQYRQPVNYTQRALDEAGDRLYYVLSSIGDVRSALAAAGAEGAQALEQAGRELATGKGAGAALRSEALSGLLDDLNTPLAVAAMSAPLKAVNDLLTTKAGKKQPGRLVLLAHLVLGLEAVLDMLGLTVHSGHDDVLRDLRRLALVRAGVTEQDIAARLAERAEARKAKDFARSDAIRLGLEAQGILIMDTAQGSSWRPGVPPEQAA